MLRSKFGGTIAPLSLALCVVVSVGIYSTACAEETSPAPETVAPIPAGSPDLTLPSNPNEAVVIWERDRCEYVLIQKADGHGIIMQFSAERLKPGDVIESEFHFSVNSGKKFTNKGTGETGMLRGYKFGLTRKQALKHFPKSCKAPTE